jgi:hypothetical protein
MKRIFSDIPEDKNQEVDQTEFLVSLGGSRGSDWADLLESDRILIISEAGAGKTFECRSQQESMWQAGEPAFFLELAELAKANVREMLSPTEENRFDAWRSAQSERATFFLDSYDELKLTQGSFEQALKRLAKAIDGQLGRVRIIITSRPIPIDQDRFRQILPIPEAAEDGANGVAFADIVMNGRRKKANDDSPPPWRNVALMPLTDEQIRDMVQSEGITNPDALIADIRKRNAEEFVRRPQDLIELCADWRVNRRIRTHREQVSSNIKIKLAARTDRKEAAPLSVTKAIDGARRLALAALLTRKLTLRHSAAADRGDSTQAALDPARILPDWTPDERTTLLERALFGFASYGRVRFHHRSVIEYLASERITALIARGMSIKAAKRLLFATTAQGDEVVKPSMRPVAAWMALDNDGIFEQVRRRDPETLLNHGDPESLRSSQRVEALQAFVERYGAGGWRGLQVPGIQIHRFATPELAADIKLLWDSIENPEVREILLNVIGAGNITDCADIAYRVATNSNVSYGERVDAIDALATLLDDRLDCITESMTPGSTIWPDRIIRWTAIRLFPQQLSIQRLCQLLGKIDANACTTDECSWQLVKIIENSKFPDDALEELRAGLTELVSEGLSWNNEWPHITSKRKGLVLVLAAICERQLQQQPVTKQLIASIVIALRLMNRDSGRQDEAKELRDAIGKSGLQNRMAAFEADDLLMQHLRPLSDSSKRFIETAWNGPIDLSTSQDKEWVRGILADPAVASDKRAVMLEAAIRMWDGTGVERDYLATLQPLVADIPELVERVNTRPQLPAANPEQKKLEAKLSRQRQQDRRRTKKAHESWIKFWREVADHPNAVFAPNRAKSTAWDLWKAMERAGQDSRAAGWNRRFIELNFGQATADRLRTTLMAAWRADRPTLRSERKEEEKNTYLVRWQLGLAAITAEAEDLMWATKLSPDEAALAARYAPLELNGFPIWLESLVRSHPSSVDAVLGVELSLELDEAFAPGSAPMTLQNIGHAALAVVSIFLPRLEKWLDTVLERTAHQYEMPSDSRLSQVIRILLEHGADDVRERLHAIAASQLANGLKIKSGYVWLPVLMRLAPSAGIEMFERAMSTLAIEARGEAVDWFNNLFGDRFGEIQVSQNLLAFTPEQLLRLTRVGFQHVRPCDDMDHQKSYSPDFRDRAERGRDVLLNMLLNTKGADGWTAKLSMIDDPLFAHLRDRAMMLARERSAEESDAATIDEDELVHLDGYNELAPPTSEDMFALLVDRVDDLDDVLLQDDSPRASWALIPDETTMRQVIARELGHAARSAYTVDQEAVTADNKETDIRLRSTGSGQQATIELKIGDKSRSGAELRSTLKEQLITKYMAPNNARSGCLLITVATSRRWDHPDTGEKLDLAGLIAMLNEEAKRLQQDLGGELRLFAKGLDLTPRLPTEKKKATEKIDIP